MVARIVLGEAIAYRNPKGIDAGAFAHARYASINLVMATAKRDTLPTKSNWLVMTVDVSQRSRALDQ